MRCTGCGSENPDSKRFCGDCGSPLGNRCPNCGSDNLATKKFCGDCGAQLPTNAPTVAAETLAATPTEAIRVTSAQADASTLTDGERKTVTALFADIKGSTKLMRDLDPEEARAIVDPVPAYDRGGASLRRLHGAIHGRRRFRLVRRPNRA
jgi:hypothetical protein